MFIFPIFITLYLDSLIIRRLTYKNKCLNIELESLILISKSLKIVQKTTTTQKTATKIIKNNRSSIK